MPARGVIWQGDKMMNYITGILALVAVSSVTFTTIQTRKVDSLKSDIGGLKSELATCGGQLSNILEDVRSDNAIDELPDSALVRVPDHWLSVVPTAGGE